MKKCPVCKAELAENANFCIYCMTSFESKEKIDNEKAKKSWWVRILVVILVLALISCLIWAMAKINMVDNIISNMTTSPSDYYTTIGDESAGAITTTTTQDESTNLATTQIVEATTIPSVITTTVWPTSSLATTTTAALTTTTTSVINTTSYPVFSTTTTEAPVEIVYTYRPATAAEVYPSGYGPAELSGPVVVITGVNTISPNGVYIVPEYIDGNKVGAIMQEAFCNPYISLTVKTVILPKTVRSVWDDAFRDCYNMTDLYTSAPKIHIYKNAFANASNRTGTLTIHCSYDCITYDYYLYRNIAYKYDALYEEWDG